MITLVLIIVTYSSFYNDHPVKVERKTLQVEASECDSLAESLTKTSGDKRIEAICQG